MEWSASFYALVGLQPGQLPPTPDLWMAMVHPEDRRRVQDSIKNAKVAAGPIDLEWRTILPDGSTRWLMSRYHVDGGRREHAG